MNCEDARHTALLAESGEATSEDALQLEAHLADCSACRDAIAEDRDTVAALRNLRPAPVLPAHLRKRVLDAAPLKRKPATILRILPWAIGLAAALAIALSLPVVDPTTNKPDNSETAHIAEAIFGPTDTSMASETDKHIDAVEDILLLAKDDTVTTEPVTVLDYETIYTDVDEMLDEMDRALLIFDV